MFRTNLPARPFRRSGRPGRPLAAALLAALIGLSALAVPAAAADITFPAASLVIPMDTKYQDYGMFKAYGLVYNLLQNGVPVYWSIEPGKTYGGVDFTATTRDDRTKAAVTPAPYGYSGGPFIVDGSDPVILAKAQSLISAWWLANANQPAVHEATASFTANVDIRLTAAPKIAVDQVNSAIAIDYFNAAGIPDLNGGVWSASSPNILSPTMIACGNATSCTGDTTIGNSALFQAGACTKKSFDIFVTPHNSGYAYSLTDPSNLGTQYYAELDYFVYQGGGWIALCHSILSNEDYIADLYLHSSPAVRALFQSTASGGFLTKYGFVDIDNAGGTFTVNPGTADLPIAQAVPRSPGAVQSLPGGSVQTWHAPDGTTSYVQYWDATERIAYFQNGADAYDMVVNGVYHNGTGRGKMTFLGGHHYTTSVPYSTNTESPYLRFFYDALFYNGSAVANLNLVTTPVTVPQGSSATIHFAVTNTGASDAMDLNPITITLAAGFTYAGTTGIQPTSVVAGPGGTTILTYDPPTSPWNIAPGNSPIVVNATYVPSTTGVFHAADLSSTYYGDVYGEPFTANACASVIVTPTPAASITKTPAATGPVSVGDVVTWTLSYANPGDVGLLNPVVEDVLPSAFTFTSASPAPTYVIPLPGGGTKVQWVLASPLAAHGTGSITLRAAVQTNTGQPFTNTATLRGTDTGGNVYTATATATVSVNPPQADLGKAVSPVGEVDAGATLTYSLSPHSTGPLPQSMFSGVRLFDAPPANTTYLAGSVTQGGTYGPYPPIAAVDGDDPGSPPAPSTLVHIGAGTTPFTYAMGASVTVTMTLTNRDAAFDITGATPTALTPSDGLSTCSGPTPASATVPRSGGTASFTFTCTIGSLGEIVWDGGASGTFNGAPYDFFSATSSSVLGVSTATGTNVLQWFPTTNTNTPAAPSSSYAPGSGPGLFAFDGTTATRNIWERYDIAGNAWITSPTGLTNNLPGQVGDGAAMVWDGNPYATGYVYAFQGGGTSTFWRYKLSNGTAGTWTAVAAAPWSVGAGGALTRLGGYLYALRGANTTGFARYDLAAGTWTDLTLTAPVPAAVNAGGALATDGTYVYAVRGGGKNNFYRYDPATTMWTTMANAPWGIGQGGALTAIGTTIYCLRGNSNNFAKFVPNATTGKWTKLPNALGTVKAGGALATDGTTIWALQGDNKKGFWAYNPATNSWTAKASTLANVTTGGALAWIPGSSGATLTNSLSAPTLVTGSAASPTTIQVVQTLTSSTAIANVSPTSLTVASTNAVPASGTPAANCTVAPSTPQSIGAGGTLLFTWTCTNVYATGTTLATTFGSLTFSAGATGTATSWTSATSNSVLVTRPLTYQVTVNTSPNTFTEVQNVALLSDNLAFAKGVASNTVVTPIRRPPHLVVTKSVAPAAGSTVGRHDTLTYTLVVQNTTPGQATSVIVTDSVPGHTAYVSCGTSVGTCGQAGGIVTWNVGTLPGFGSATLTMTVTAETDYAGSFPIDDTAHIAYDGTGGPFSGTSNTVTNTLYAPPSPTISKAESAVPAPDENGLIVPGATITYTMPVVNPAGAVIAESVVAFDAVPPGTTFQSCSPAPCSLSSGPTPPAGTVVWTIGTMNPGTTVTITLVVTVDSPAENGATVVNGATVTAATNIPGTTYAKDSNLVTYTIKASPILGVEKTVSPADGTEIAPGDTLTYTLTVRNTGDAITETAWITDAIPPGATYVANSTTLNGAPVADVGGLSPVTGTMPVYSPCCPDPLGEPGGQLVPVVPSPPPQNEAVVTFRVKVADPPAVNGTLVQNTATVGSSSTDPVDSNTVTNPVYATPNVTIVKTNSPTGAVTALDEITYTIVVTNVYDPLGDKSIGGMTAVVTVTDPVSPYAIFESVDAPGSYDSGTNTVTWSDLTLLPGQQVTLKYRVLATDLYPSGDYTIVNTAATEYTRYATWDDAGTLLPLDSTVSNPLRIPTEAKVRDLRVVQDGEKVLLTWQTSVERGNLGFNVWREENGVTSKVNPTLIAGNAFTVRGPSPKAGSAYRLRDTLSSPGSLARYWLEDVDTRGQRTLHDPVAWTRGPVTDSGNTVPLAGAGSDDTLESDPGVGYVQPDALPAPTAPQIQAQRAIANSSGLKLFVSREGWYRISRAEMAAAGFDPGPNPGAITLSSSGISVPIVVNAGKDRVFDPADTIEFYGLGIDTPSTGARTYWLQTGSAAKRLGTVANKRGTRWSDDVSFVYHRSERAIYAPALTGAGTADSFVGTIITSDPVTVGVPAGAIDTAYAGDAALEIVLQGSTDATDGHGVSIAINGHAVGEIAFGATERPTFAAAFPQAWLATGDNAITLRALHGDVDVSAVVSIRLTYRHLLAADEGLLEAQLPPSATVTVTGFPSAAIRALDVTDPLAPSALAVAVGGSADAYTATFTTPPASTPRTILVFSDGRTLAIPESAPNAASAWSSPSGKRADLVILTHGSFSAAAAVLQSARRSAGLETVVVDVEDLFDEYGFGVRSPGAIRQFLQATKGWSLAPRWVVLLGDASFDPRDYLGLGSYDFVPTKLLAMGGLMSASDDWFADFDDDGVPEIAVGRLSARTPDEAMAIVSKILSRGTPSGPWSARALLVADVPDTYDFAGAIASFAALFPAGIAPQTMVRGTPGFDPIGGFNAGQLLVDYAGHGSNEIWRGTLDSTAAMALGNGTRLPFVVSLTCLNGFFQDVYTTSLAEAFMKAPGGGAFAVWASSTLTSPEDQVPMNQELLRRLFGPERLTIGEAVVKAKAEAANPDVRKSWILFGDPSMTLR